MKTGFICNSGFNVVASANGHLVTDQLYFLSNFGLAHTGA